MKRLKLIALSVIVLLVSACLVAAIPAPSTTDRLFVYTLTTSGFYLQEITGMVRTATGWAVPTATPGDTIARGDGISLTRVPGQPVVVSIDTGQFYMWVSPPTSPGECRSTQPLSDQKILAHDSQFLYVCAPYSDGNTKGTRWGRTPLEFSW